jgi:hypothetical protein
VRNFDWLPFTPPLVASSVLHRTCARSVKVINLRVFHIKSENKKPYQKSKDNSQPLASLKLRQVLLLKPKKTFERYCGLSLASPMLSQCKIKKNQSPVQRVLLVQISLFEITPKERIRQRAMRPVGKSSLLKMGEHNNHIRSTPTCQVLATPAVQKEQSNIV